MATDNTYSNGSAMLLYIGDQAVGHCTTSSVTLGSDSKDIKVKAPASESTQDFNLWSDKSISGLSISAQAEGYIHNAETEAGYEALAAAWYAAKPVTAKYQRRGDAKAWLDVPVMITSLERTDPAQEESTYSISVENCGKPTTFSPEALAALKNS